MSIRTISFNSKDLIKADPKLFLEEIRKIPGYEHKVRLASNAIPEIKKINKITLKWRREIVQGRYSKNSSFEIRDLNTRYGSPELI